MGEGGAVTGRAPLVVSALLGAALLAVLVVRTPWQPLPVPPGGRSPLDPASVLPEDRLAVAEAETVGELTP